MDLRIQMSLLQAGSEAEDTGMPAVPPAGSVYNRSDTSTLLGQLTGSNEVTMTGFDETGCWAQVESVALSGWCHLSGLIPSEGKDVPWLKVAQREIGVDSNNGAERIKAYRHSLSDPPDPGENWCACFINWCMKRANQPSADSSRAKHWIKRWPNSKERRGDGRIPGDALVGDIAIGERLEVNGTHGHIAILVTYEVHPTDPWKDRILLLGGNQGHDPFESTEKKAVRYTWYPRESPPPRYGKFLQARYQL